MLKLPIRPPALVAKQAGSLAAVFGNRLGRGVGASPWPEDYELLGVPFAERVKRMDECIDIIRPKPRCVGRFVATGGCTGAAGKGDVKSVITASNIPILLVCADPLVVSALHRTGVTRRVAALATLGPRGIRRHRAKAVLPADLSSLRRSRALVDQWLTAWTQVGLIPVTQVIITALVENVQAHATSWPQVRLETDGTTVTIAVEDDTHAQASVRETAEGSERPSGLRIVNALCRHWGNAPTPSGKTVWAVVGPENRL